MKKKIFFKKNKIFNFFHFLLFFLFIVSASIFYKIYFTDHNKYILISSAKDNFYIIPKNKGGKKIENLRKQSLHLSYENVSENNTISNESINFSIQIFSDDDFFFFLDKKNELLNKKKDILSENDFNIFLFNSNLQNQFILLYKSFKIKSEALEYCNKYVFFVDKCLIINTKNLD